jgi:hypothetical protein
MPSQSAIARVPQGSMPSVNRRRRPSTPTKNFHKSQDAETVDGACFSPQLIRAARETSYLISPPRDTAAFVSYARTRQVHFPAGTAVPVESSGTAVASAASLDSQVVQDFDDDFDSDFDFESYCIEDRLKPMVKHMTSWGLCEDGEPDYKAILRQCSTGM